MPSPENVINELTIDGDKLYQERARKTLPILVRQATAQQSIIYEDMALELGMPNPRNLNYVLGAIGSTLLKLSNQWKQSIPPIQGLVINKKTGMPGEGLNYYITDNYKIDYVTASDEDKRNTIKKIHIDIFNYQNWDRVLKALNLKKLENAPIIQEDIKNMNSFPRGKGVGESEKHKRLKEYIAKNPFMIGLKVKSVQSELEFDFPSGDTLDVIFKSKDLWTGIEVKSEISDNNDILRGLFQCVKYNSLIKAYQKYQNIVPNSRVILALENEFPSELIPLKNQLGVEVIDHIVVK